MAEIQEKQLNQINKSTNCKPSHRDQRVVEENKELEEKSNCPLKYFAVNRSTLEACRRTVTQQFWMKLATRIIHSIKGISNITVN